MDSAGAEDAPVVAGRNSVAAEDAPVVAGRNSVVAEDAPVVAGGNSVVAEDAPVVAGDAKGSLGYQASSVVGEQVSSSSHDNPDNPSSSVVAEHTDFEEMSYYQASSLVASKIDADLIEAGDLEYSDDFKELTITFTTKDWMGSHNTTTMKGDWTSQMEPPRNHEGSFAFENFNFGQRRHDSAALERVCKVLRDGGSQLFTLQEANNTLMQAILRKGRVQGDRNWIPNERVSSPAVVTATHDASSPAVVTATHDAPGANTSLYRPDIRYRGDPGDQAAQTASSSGTAATAAADPPNAVVAADHEIYFVSYNEGIQNGLPVPTLAFGGRSSLVRGLRLMLFRRMTNGLYGKAEKKSQAITRIAVAEFLMNRFACTDPTKTEEDKTEEEKKADRTLVVANVHLHHAVCNNNSNLKSKDAELKKIYDELAVYIIRFKVRLVSGDFNMDTLRVLSELRGRGFLANVISWFAWKKTGGDIRAQPAVLGDPHVTLDSVLIIALGPTDGVRSPFDGSVFGMNFDSVVAECCRRTTRWRKDDAGQWIEEFYTLQNYHANGSGHQLSAYRPQDGNVKRDLIKWMTTSMPYNTTTWQDDVNIWGWFQQWMQTATAGRAIAKLQDVNRHIGDATWTWPRFPMCKCKPMLILEFESGNQIFNKGSHIPLITFIGNAKDKARGDQAFRNREDRASRRGKGWDKASRDRRDKRDRWNRAHAGWGWSHGPWW